MSRPIVVVDLETTGLFPECGHEMWETAAIEYGYGGQRAGHLWRVEPDPCSADEEALTVNGFRERTASMMHSPAAVLHDLAVEPSATWGYWSEPEALAAELARILSGVTIVGANPAFDAGFLAAFLAEHGRRPPWPWHYRIRDVQSLAYGYLARGRDPALIADGLAPQTPAFDASTDEFALALGLDLAAYDRHSALGDCRLAANMLDVITGGQP